MRQAIGEDLAGAIFFGILTGSVTGALSIRQIPQPDDLVPSFVAQSKIEAIRNIRAVTGWGLRDSKDFIESLDQSGNYRQLEPNEGTDIVAFKRDMMRAGYEVF